MKNNEKQPKNVGQSLSGKNRKVGAVLGLALAIGLVFGTLPALSVMVQPQRTQVTESAQSLLSGRKILFVTRNQYRTDHQNTHTMFPNTVGEINTGSYTGGGAIKVLDYSTGQAITLWESTTGVFRDLDLHFDGTKFLVSYRESKTTSYNIWECTLNGAGTAITEKRQLTAMNNSEDMDPMYLPSGQIIFSSTRDPKYVMCNRHISANIYRMEHDGANIVKITNSTLFERPSDVLDDGRILYDRWEYVDMHFGNAQGLWTVNPDGTQQVTYYGNNTPTAAIINGKQIPGTQNVLAILSSCHGLPTGALAIIDRSKGVDGRDPILKTWPATAINAMKDHNQVSRGAIGSSIDTYQRLSMQYEDPYLLSGSSALVSRFKEIGNNKMVIACVNLETGTEEILYEDGTYGCFDAAVIEPREEEFVLQEKRNYNDADGTFFVQNVYSGEHMAGVAPGSVKSLRVVESITKEYITQSISWSSASGAQYPGVNWHSLEVKKVLGEVPVYEDGSAYFTVPQDKFVYFQLLDEEGRMIQSMRSGTLVQSGESTGCVGCHDDRRTSVLTNNTRKTPMALEQNFTVINGVGVNQPDKPTLYAQTEGGTVYNGTHYDKSSTMNYLTEVQPIFNKSCISCHGYENPAGSVTLVPDKSVIFNASYVDLWRNRSIAGVYNNNLVGAIGGGSSEFTRAMTWGSYKSPLVNIITGRGSKGVAHQNRLSEAGISLTREESRKIMEWVDLNGTYYGSYATNYPANPGGRSVLTLAELNTIPGGLQWVFDSSEKRAAPIYFDNPEKSPILKRWAVDSTDYKKVLSLVRTGKERLARNPDSDQPGFTMRLEDQWRTEKVAVRSKIEAENRAAIKNGSRLYDWDHTQQDPTMPWPGWNK